MFNVFGSFTLCILALTANPMAWSADKTFEQKLRDGKVLAEAGRFKDAVAILKRIEPEQREDELSVNCDWKYLLEARPLCDCAGFLPKSI